jgi:SAM-dependent methyltransferase
LSPVGRGHAEYDPAVEWVRDFYSVTGRWWGRAESAVGQVDLARVAALHAICGDTPKRILELGCGYGSTVAAMTEAGHRVIGVEISDRADFSEQFVAELGRASRIVKDDFYTVQLDGPFDVVCYWNGFGVGSDTDQRALLRRVAEEWLAEGGTALIDISNPFVWARWDGDQEYKPKRPEDGYDYDLGELTQFDPIRNRFADTWWADDNPGEKWTQSIRCYTPADLRLLLEGTGLTLDAVLVSGEIVDLDQPQLGLASLLREAYEYLAVLARG